MDTTTTILFASLYIASCVLFYFMGRTHEVKKQIKEYQQVRELRKKNNKY